jgi:hypothetical protein
MKQIRKNVFETNSSSTHALCLDITNKYEKYTKEHLEAFTDVIYPFSREEASKFSDPHVFVDLKDKLRYFWTIFVSDYFGDVDSEQGEFMCKLQTLVPQASFGYKFPYYREHVWYRENAAYMEDATYVLNGEEDSVTRWPIGELEAFLLNGVIVFGDRDNYDYFLQESRIKLFISDNKLKVIEDYTG